VNTKTSVKQWRDRMFAYPVIIDGEMIVLDDGYEQQGLYIRQGEDLRPLSHFLLANSDLDGLKDHDDLTLGNCRVVISFIPLEDES